MAHDDFVGDSNRRGRTKVLHNPGLVPLECRIPRRETRGEGDRWDGEYDVSESAAGKETNMTEPPVAQTVIVVGVDGSDSSRQALTWAVHYAALIGAGVDAVISWSYPTGYGIGAVTAEWNPGADASDLLAKTVAAVLGDEIPVPLTQVVREGNAAQVLLDETKDAQMLVVGSRGHGGFAGLLLGSVSAHCAEHAHCPVLVIHGKAQS
jgi:nucleotide-binding universal stress UspA family protein